MKFRVHHAALAALALLAVSPAEAQKRSLVVANSTADAGKLDPHQTAVGADKATAVLRTAAAANNVVRRMEQVPPVSGETP